MRLIFSTDEYSRSGRPRPGFPLLLDEDMEPLEPFHSFLVSRLFGEEVPTGKAWGGGLDRKTQEGYGRIVWDYAQFLRQNELRWDEPFAAVADSVFSQYRDWSHVELGHRRKTIRWRLRLIADFYEWALHTGRIDRMPFSRSTFVLRGSRRAYGDGSDRTVTRIDQALPEWIEEPAFLTGEQIRVARSAIKRTAHRLLFDLMTRVGLRSCEARTFPTKYVFDPATKPLVRSGSMLEVLLRPGDMEIKFKKPRVVHVPYDLMEDLHQYFLTERNKDLCEPGFILDPLILTKHGAPFSKDSTSRVFASIAKEVGTKVKPLMLRHSYAIHTLLFLRQHPEIPVEPLLYVRDRLGHSSVETTMVYLHQIDRLLGAEALEMMSEFDALYGVRAAFGGLQRAELNTPTQ